MEDGTRQPRPATPADLHRLAALAQARGLRLTQEQSTVWFCSSVSSPERHYVTGLSCDCRGFMEHQRCTHYALLLDHLGWLPEIEDAPAPVPINAGRECLWCFGSGLVPNDDAHQYDACAPCDGTGQRSAPAADVALAA
jgi:hypothetical protein